MVLTLSCSSFSRQLKIQNKLDQKIRDNFGKDDKNHSFIRIFSTSKVVLLLIETTDNSRKEIKLIGRECNLTGKVDSRSCPLVEGIKLLELDLFTSNFF